MSSIFERLLRRKPNKNTAASRNTRLILGESVIKALQDCLSKEIHQKNEGVAYLFGQSDDVTTLAVSAYKPEAETTPGSFFVSAPSMAKVVRAASNLGLQVVGQVHTHPGHAFHSNGDNAGARIAYSGFVSIVLPSYGRHLPSLNGAAFYMYYAERGFVELNSRSVHIIPGRIK
ncbi:MAG: Mov34/MPN/PAD-1 family protein [Nitrospirae bacterium]|nr:Mov34/MPN/PAD-1 family protein [Nitrospirota bacterium]